MPSVIAFLEKLGFSEIEIKIYLKLLELGPSSVMELSQASGIKRATTHFNVQNMIQKGLVTQSVFRNKRKLVAEPPENLGHFIDEKLSEFNKLKDTLPTMVDSISSMMPVKDRNSELEIKVYEGRKSVKLIYDDVLRAKELRAYLNTKEVIKAFPENVKLFIDAHNARKDMKIWEITENSQELVQDYISKMAKGRYFHKSIPMGMDLSVIDYLIYDGKVAIINPTGKVNGLVISNPFYYANTKAIFEFIWAVLPE